MTPASIVTDFPQHRQSRAGSLLEAVVNVVFGFLWAFVMQGLIYPFLGIVTSAQTNLLIAAMFTLLSLARSYLVRLRDVREALMRGRKPKPTHLKLLEGNPGKRRLNAAEPKPERRVPTCPSHLCAPAKAEWKRLAAQLTVLRILTELDRAAMAAYCQAYGRWVEAERKLQETPLLLKMPSGYVQQNPWLTIANKQLELMHKYLSEFGLSPVSRSRVSVTPSFGPKPWEFGQSKFAGLLGGQKDEFFDD